MITSRIHSVTHISMSTNEALELIRQLAAAIASANRGHTRTFLEPVVLNDGNGHGSPGVVEFKVFQS